eukprot:scaffold56665_cov49-Attheya_sp.AAC.2
MHGREDSYSQQELQEVADMTNAPMEVVLAGIHDKYSLFQDCIPCMIGNGDDDDDDSNDKSLLLSALKQSMMPNDKQGDNDVDSDGTVMEVHEEEHERMAREIGEISSGEAPSWLQDRDMILLATRDMVAGEELLLTYKDDSSTSRHVLAIRIWSKWC